MVGQWFSNGDKAVEYLVQRTEDQKAQEPRRKFVEDHHLIQNRRKNEPCIPILPGHDQETWFAKLDGNEIWEKVFEYVTNPSDVTSAYYSCEMFRKHLEEKRNVMQLAKVVFEVLRDEGYLTYPMPLKKGKSVSIQDKEERKEILKLRLVSKSWKKLTEEVFLLPVHLSESHYIWEGEHQKPWRHFSCEFGSIEDVDKAMKNLRNPNSCASLLRVVVVKYGQPTHEERNKFHSKLLQFLEVHGEAVWDLHVINEGFGLTLANKLFYVRLQNLLLEMPQLKALHVTNNEWEQSVVLGVEEFPFLPSLELCAFRCDPEINEFFMSEILSRNVNLKAVLFGYTSLDDDEWDQIYSFLPDYVWWYLEDLRLEYFEVNYDQATDNWDFSRDWEGLGKQNWPLKVLRVLHGEPKYPGQSRNPDLEYCFESVADFFNVLHRFNDSLVEFSFRTDHWALFKEEDTRDYNLSVVVDLPHLKEINFEFGWERSWYQDDSSPELTDTDSSGEDDQGNEQN